MGYSGVESLERIARGYALDLLEAIGEVDGITEVDVAANDANGLPSVTYSAYSGGRLVWRHHLVGGEVPASAKPASAQ